MKLILAICISAVVIQEVVPGTLVRFRRNTNNSPSYLHTEYEAHIEQTGKHGNESYGKVSGKQAIEQENCNDDWNAFANKCAELIKDLVASLANAVSSKPGDATNLQLHIKNTFRHLDRTHNCSCLSNNGTKLSDIDLSHLFDNLTLSNPATDSDHNDKESSKGTDVISLPTIIKSTHIKSGHNGDEEDCNGDNDGGSHSHHMPVLDKKAALASALGSIKNGGNNGDDCNENCGEGKSVPIVVSSTLPEHPEKSSDDHDDHHEGEVLITPKPVAVAPKELIVENHSISQPNAGDKDSANCDDESPTLVEVPKSTTNGDEDCSTNTQPACDTDKNDGGNSPALIVPVSTSDDNSGNNNGDCGDCNNDDSKSEVIPVAVVPVEQGTTSDEGDCDNDDSKSGVVPVAVVPVEQGKTSNEGDCDSCDSKSEVVPVAVIPVEKGTTSNEGDCDKDDSKSEVVPVAVIPVEKGTTSNEGDCDKDDSKSEVVPVAVVPVEQGKTSNEGDCDKDDSKSEVVPVAVIPVEKGTTSNEGDCDKDDSKSGVLPVAVVPVEQETTSKEGGCDSCDSKSGHDSKNGVAPIAVVPVEHETDEGNCDKENKGGQIEVTEVPELVQPTTFQTTSEEPTYSPVGTKPSPDFVSITTPQKAHEGTHNNHDDEDEDDDCCSCESCSEDEEESDPKKVKENVCKSLDEARRELKTIFDKIKKKLRCCRKEIHTITTNPSSIS